MLIIAWDQDLSLPPKYENKRNRLDSKKTPSFNDICLKHKVSPRDLEIQLSKGIKVETGHTSNLALAREIALNHLNEYPDYYDRLEKVEK